MSAIDASALWAGTRIGLRSATGLPPALYTDVGLHQLELERVFHRAWVCVGLSSELAQPGTVLVRRIGDRSIVLTVADDGATRGFLNSCRHRGTELVESDCTVRNTLRCPYHRWGYALDGRLVATPRFDATTRDRFDREDFGLVPVRVATWGCLTFACLDPRTPPLEVWLGDLPQRLAGYELESWRVQEELDVEIDANWKLISENFQEYYHLPWVHPRLAKVSRVDDHYRYQGHGLYCGQTTTPVSDDSGSTWLSLPPKPDLDRSDATSGRHLAIFPNVILSVLPNHTFVMRLEPEGPGRTRETCSWLLPSAAAGDDVDRAAYETIRDFWLDVNAEDIAIVERSQRGLTRGAVPPGPLVPRFEEPLHRFHNMVADLMTVASPAEVTVPPGDTSGADPALGGRADPNPSSWSQPTAGR